MKKISLALSMFLFAALAWAATPAAPVKPKPVVLTKAQLVEKTGFEMKPRRERHGSSWNNYTGPVDSAWRNSIKVQLFSCPKAAGENCNVLATYFLGGGSDSGVCNLVNVDEVNVYPNLVIAGRVLNRCSEQPQFQRTQKFVDPDGDGILTPSVFLEWRFTIVRTQL